MTSIKGITEFGDCSHSRQIEVNMKHFFDWGLLQIGGFRNVYLAASGFYGGDESRLRLVNDPGYTAGQVWEAPRKDWVWESGITYSVQPIEISGVWVNATFHPSTGVGPYAHTVDYPNGRVVFSSAISNSATVQVEHSYRRVQIRNTDFPEFVQLELGSYRVDDPSFLSGSGIHTVLGQNRLQLPLVALEVSPRREFTGKQLGGGQWMDQDVFFHIFSERREDRDKLIDVISLQNNKTITLFNTDEIAEANAMPLDINGSIATQATRNYETLIDPNQYYWRKAYTSVASVQTAQTLNHKLYKGVVKLTLTVDMPEI